MLKNIVNLSSLTERTIKKRERCSCDDGNCGQCMHGWFFNPYYGKGDGRSDAAITTGAGAVGMTGMDLPSGAFPGAGGVNSPGVAAGPNSGMGPVTMNRAMDLRSHSLFFEVQNLFEIIKKKGK